MSAETRSVGRRVSTLTQDITVLSNKTPLNNDYLTISDCRSRSNLDADDMAERLQKEYCTIPMLLPIERTHSQPPLLQINDVWESDYIVGDENSSDNHISPGSNEEFEVQVIKSSRFENHHTIMITSPNDRLFSDDGSSDNLENNYCSDHDEDVFDNSQT